MAKTDQKNNPKTVGNIYLSGFMCAGKTTTGKVLARLLGRPFCDTDTMLERSSKKSVGQIVSQRGWRGWRALEKKLVGKLAGGKPAVVALGGGIYPVRLWQKTLRKSGVVIFLSCPWKTLSSRLKAGRGGRPLLAGDPDTALRRAKKLYDSRLPFYLKADLVIKTAGLTPGQTAARIKGKI